MVEEVIEVEFKLAFGFDPDNLTQCVQKFRLPISRKAHHPVLIAVAEKSQILGHGEVEEPEGMGKRHAIEDFNPFSLATTDHRADKIPESIYRGYGARFERRHQKRRG